MPKLRKPPTKAPRDAYRTRPCRLCKAKFKPTTHVVACADSQQFCCANHRKEYWKYGGLPFEKLMVRIEKRCREVAREEADSALRNATAQLFSLQEEIYAVRRIAEKAVNLFIEIDPRIPERRPERRVCLQESPPRSTGEVRSGLGSAADAGVR